ncbi:hypothetical protein B0H17DRAFT_1206295 [Mycena rosella]|uniref:Uncharacterized protein n=1 Tax=Mycena rosella TaxID=1033263 RepID=A0AAD7D5V3_MYCRO|nr:hypothetical protein B0H17DRAFT_1206295 [Mycena rosella]
MPHCRRTRLNFTQGRCWTITPSQFPRSIPFSVFPPPLFSGALSLRNRSASAVPGAISPRAGHTRLGTSRGRALRVLECPDVDVCAVAEAADMVSMAVEASVQTKTARAARTHTQTHGGALKCASHANIRMGIGKTGGAVLWIWAGRRRTSRSHPPTRRTSPPVSPSGLPPASTAAFLPTTYPRAAYNEQGTEILGRFVQSCTALGEEMHALRAEAGELRAEIAIGSSGIVARCMHLLQHLILADVEPSPMEVDTETPSPGESAPAVGTSEVCCSGRTAAVAEI